MKKDVISLLALMLAAAALVLSIASVVRKPEVSCGHEEEIAALRSELSAVYERLEALENVKDNVSPAATGRADLFINEWEERDGTLTLTSAYIQVLASGEASIDKAQLILFHNGVEHNRADITLEVGETEGSYQCTLSDTWFVLPEMEEDDLLDVHLVVTLSNGNSIVSPSSSWYATADGLYAVVG